MRVFRGFEALPAFKRAVATVGSFDGLHAGHRVLLARLVEEAARVGGESVVLTFDPHPRQVLGARHEVADLPDTSKRREEEPEGLRLLTSLDEKIRGLESLGIDNLIVIPFDQEFARLSGEEFLRDYLVGRVGAEALVAGYNHRFGRDGAAPSDGLLRVVRVEAHEVDGAPVSSTRIRRLLRQGETEEAARLLNEK